MRRKKNKDIGDLTISEYKELKKETDERIDRDYVSGNILVVTASNGTLKKGMKGICFFEPISWMNGTISVIRKAIFDSGEEIQLGYRYFDSVSFLGEKTESIDKWIEENVSEHKRKRKRNY